MRYFCGLDLNFDKHLVARVLAGVAGGAKYLAVARVAIRSSEISIGVAELEDVKLRPEESSGYRRLERDHKGEG